MFNDASGLPYLISADSSPSVSDWPILILVVPDSPIISSDVLFSFLIDKHNQHNLKQILLYKD